MGGFLLFDLRGRNGFIGENFTFLAGGTCSNIFYKITRWDARLDDHRSDGFVDGDSRRPVMRKQVAVEKQTLLRIQLGWNTSLNG